MSMNTNYQSEMKLRLLKFYHRGLVGADVKVHASPQ